MIDITIADGITEKTLLQNLRQRSGEIDKKVTTAVTDILENSSTPAIFAGIAFINTEDGYAAVPPGTYKPTRFKPRMRCPIETPLGCAGGIGSNFRTVRCDCGYCGDRYDTAGKWFGGGRGNHQLRPNHIRHFPHK